jgi:hypothetical protein
MRISSVMSLACDGVGVAWTAAVFLMAHPDFYSIDTTGLRGGRVFCISRKELQQVLFIWAPLWACYASFGKEDEVSTR